MPMIQSGHAVRPFFCCRVICIASSILNSLPAILGMSVMPMSRLCPWGEQKQVFMVGCQIPCSILHLDLYGNVLFCCR